MDWEEWSARRNRRRRTKRTEGGVDWSRVNTRQIGWIIVFIIIGLWLLSGVFFVEPSEKGVVLRFGKLSRITDPGPSWHIPWPFESAEKPRVTEIKRIEVGFRTIDPGPPAKYRPIDAESHMLTGDENIVSIWMIVQYVISDPVKFLFNVRDARPDLQSTVKDAAEAAIRQVIGDRGIDEALTIGKLEIQADVKDLLQSIVDSYETGLLIMNVQLQDVHPPAQVSDAFKDVASAKEDKQRLIREAEGYRNAILPEARGRVAQIVREAEGYRDAKIRRATGDASRFNAMYAEYVKAPDITRRRLYLETLEEILPGTTKFVIDPKSSTAPLPLLPLTDGRLGMQRGSKK